MKNFLKENKESKKWKWLDNEGLFMTWIILWPLSLILFTHSFRESMNVFLYIICLFIISALFLVPLWQRDRQK